MTTKKKILIAIIAVIIVAGATIGTIFLIGYLTKSNNSSQNQAPATKESADIIKNQAIDAMISKTKSVDETRKLLEQARQQYIDLKDTNNTVNIDAQLYLLDHMPKATPPKPPTQQ